MKLNGNTSKRSAAARREAADFAAQERSAHRSGANRSAQSEAAARRAAAQAVVHRFRAGRKHFHHRFQIFFPLALRRDKYNLFEIERSKAVALAVRVHQTHLYRVEIFFHKVARQLIQRFKAHLRGAQPLVFYRLIDKRRKHVARGNFRFAEFFAVVFEHPRQHNEIFRCHVRAGDLFDTHARPAVEMPRRRNCLHKQKFLVGVFHKSRKKRSLVLSRQRHGQPRFRNFLKKIRHTFSPSYAKASRRLVRSAFSAYAAAAILITKSTPDCSSEVQIRIFRLFSTISRNHSAKPYRKSIAETYLRIFAITPEPTVLPPSRIAKRRPSSIATGLIRTTFMLMLSPGITISTPSGSSIAPVTSVVLMKNCGL